MTNEIIPQVRRNIVDALTLEGIDFAGVKDDLEFLGRLYDLSSMPSHDSRFSDAAGDIWQHTVNNDDWDRGWVFSDARFGVMGCEDSKFLAFLAETVHPVIRPDGAEAARIVGFYNEQLRTLGWELVEIEGIAGRPCYEGRQATASRSAVVETRRVADALDAAWMHKEILRAEKAIDVDPDLAIGTAKELVETCCKTLLSKLGEDAPKNADFPELVKKAVKALKLTRDDIPETAKGADIVRTILSNLSAITKGVNELRNLYGTGHGRDGRHKGLEPRHARLAVTTAAAFVVFMSDTYRDRTQSGQRSK